jgi:hypothetical protein
MKRRGTEQGSWAGSGRLDIEAVRQFAWERSGNETGRESVGIAECGAVGQWHIWKPVRAVKIVG